MHINIVSITIQMKKYYTSKYFLKADIFPSFVGGKTQVMGEIKVALKKEVKTEGDQLVLEILQCRNITYKFKSPDHLPGLELLCASKFMGV